MIILIQDQELEKMLEIIRAEMEKVKMLLQMLITKIILLV